MGTKDKRLRVQMWPCKCHGFDGHGIESEILVDRVPRARELISIPGLGDPQEILEIRPGDGGFDAIARLITNPHMVDDLRTNHGWTDISRG